MPSTPPPDPEAGWRAFSGVERAMARRMQRAAEIPTAAMHRYVEMDAALECVQRLRDQHPQVSVTTLLVAAVARGLKAHPELAAEVDFEKFMRRVPEDPGIGVAVDSRRGLVVPVVRHATRSTFDEIAQELAAVVERAREGDRDASLFAGGNFTLTNIASANIHGGTPMLNVPQIAILGASTIRTVPVAREGRVEVGKVGRLNIAIDHRALDGMTAARFLTTVCDLIEAPADLVD